MSEASSVHWEFDASDSTAAEKLLPLVYDELRRLASRKLATENPEQTLDATGLVHELYLRLFGADSGGNSFDTRGHFLAAAAQGMRRILIDRARRRNAKKRGGDLNRQELKWAEVSASMPDEQLLALHEALDRLAESDPQKARLVELRYFVGLTSDEAARVLGISPSTADRSWAYARAWLQAEIQDG